MRFIVFVLEATPHHQYLLGIMSAVLPDNLNIYTVGRSTIFCLQHVCVVPSYWKISPPNTY